MDELNNLAQKIEEDVKALEEHPSFKPYLGFEAEIVPAPWQGGNIPLPKKIKVTGTK